MNLWHSAQTKQEVIFGWENYLTDVWRQIVSYVSTGDVRFQLRLCLTQIQHFYDHSTASMTDVNRTHPPLVLKPLYIYTLPSELLDTLILKGDSVTASQNQPEQYLKEESPSINSIKTAGCLTCNIGSFPDVSEQREHVRSDLHKFNLKRKLKGDQAVTADQFEEMLDRDLRVIRHR